MKEQRSDTRSQKPDLSFSLEHAPSLFSVVSECSTLTLKRPGDVEIDDNAVLKNEPWVIYGLMLAVYRYAGILSGGFYGNQEYQKRRR